MGCLRRPSVSGLMLIGLLLAVGLLLGSARDDAAARTKTVLILSPHPDDEVFSQSLPIQRALKAGKRVHVVVVTSGDGYPKAAAALFGKREAELTKADYIELARLRQLEDMRAMKRLGLRRVDVTYLGYPDAGLDKVYKARVVPFRSQFTGKSATYGPAYPDFRTATTGKAAPYLRGSVVADLVTIIRRDRPVEIYLPNKADQHLDHRATFWIARDAIRTTASRAKLFSWVAHAAGSFECPTPLACPAPIILQPTAREARIRAAAIAEYKTQLPVEAPGVSPELIAQRPERFWPLTLPRS